MNFFPFELYENVIDLFPYYVDFESFIPIPLTFLNKDAPIFVAKCAHSRRNRSMAALRDVVRKEPNSACMFL